jgi:hypothetical protein
MPMAEQPADEPLNGYMSESMKSVPLCVGGIASNE